MKSNFPKALGWKVGDTHVCVRKIVTNRDDGFPQIHPIKHQLHITQYTLHSTYKRHTYGEEFASFLTRQNQQSVKDLSQLNHKLEEDK